MQKIQTFVGANQFLTDDNFVLQPDSGFFCIRVHPEGDCLIPGGNKGRTAKTKMDSTVEMVLKRFFRAVEPDNQEVFDEDGFSWTNDLLNPANDNPEPIL
jgi:hypothetical protein